MATLSKDDILEAISSMSVMDLSELLKDFEEKFGVTAAAPVAVAAPVGGGGADDEAEVKDSFDVFSPQSATRKFRSSRPFAS